MIITIIVLLCAWRTFIDIPFFFFCLWSFLLFSTPIHNAQCSSNCMVRRAFASFIYFLRNNIVFGGNEQWNEFARWEEKKNKRWNGNMRLILVSGCYVGLVRLNFYSNENECVRLECFYWIITKPVKKKLLTQKSSARMPIRLGGYFKMARIFDIEIGNNLYFWPLRNYKEIVFGQIIVASFVYFD